LAKPAALASERYPDFELASKMGEIPDPAGGIHFQPEDDQTTVMGDAVDLGVVIRSLGSAGRMRSVEFLCQMNVNRAFARISTRGSF